MGVQCIKINGRRSQKFRFAQVNLDGGVQWECSALKSMGGGVKKFRIAQVKPEGGVQWECSALKSIGGGVKNSVLPR